MLNTNNSNFFFQFKNFIKNTLPILMPVYIYLKFFFVFKKRNKEILVKGNVGEIYNISGDKEISNIDLAMLIIKMMGKNQESIEFVADRKGHDQRYAIDSLKLKNTIGDYLNINFENGIQETITWYLTNPLWMVENKQ